MKTLTLLIFFLQVSIVLIAQQKYWVYFRDKGEKVQTGAYVAEKAIANRKNLGLPLFQYSDIPVSGSYINEIRSQQNVQVVNRSRWLNAITLVADEHQVAEIQKLEFVEKIVPVKGGLFLASDNVRPDNDNFALKQINAYALDVAGWTGKGVDIGVIDGAFDGAKRYPLLKHLFPDNKIIGTKDFTDPSVKDFFLPLEDDHQGHGASVLQMIGGYNETSKTRYGLAPASHYVLARTDVSENEYRGEEDNWIAALEWMDSLGVRLVNSSLGYSEDYDRPDQNYKPEQMNGETSAIAKAAQIATREKGMIIVVAAGNEGQNIDWQVVATPADAKGVIAVGATDVFGMKNRISSIGVASSSYIKPDVACYASSGTSYSAPIITGLIACMLEKDPSLKNEKILEIIRQSSHLNPYANNYLGYGIPDASRIVNILNKSTDDIATPATEVRQKGVVFSLKVDKNETPYVVIFHKINPTIVRDQEYVDVVSERLQITRPLHVTQSTIVLKNKVVEVIWE